MNWRRIGIIMSLIGKILAFVALADHKNIDTQTQIYPKQGKCVLFLLFDDQTYKADTPSV